jgi:hypothetical protein
MNRPFSSRLRPHSAWLNPDNGAIRVVFTVPKAPAMFVVVKLFGPSAPDVWTLKWWMGSSVDKVRSYWNTNHELSDEQMSEAVATARSRLRAFDVAYSSESITQRSMPVHD